MTDVSVDLEIDLWRCDTEERVFSTAMDETSWNQ